MNTSNTPQTYGNYRPLATEEINRPLFGAFIRRQEVNQCWRKSNGKWFIRPDPFVDDWTEEDYRQLIGSLKSTLVSGGFVYGAFFQGQLKGFVSVEPTLFGGGQQYLDLTNLHVSLDMRRHGIGARLFQAAKDWARAHGAKKLYLSAHSAAETQSFYLAMGCTDAQLYCQRHVEAEPFDRQMECAL